MKRVILFVAAGFAALSVAYAAPHGPGRPGGPGGPGPGFRPAPSPRPAPHHSRSGFWPGFAGGLAAGVLLDISRPSRPIPPPATIYTTQVVTPTPVVVQQPVVVSQPVVTQTVITDAVVTQPAVTTQRVWVEGTYFDRVNADGSVTRVWNPGHYEVRTVQ